MFAHTYFPGLYFVGTYFPPISVAVERAGKIIRSQVIRLADDRPHTLQLDD